MEKTSQIRIALIGLGDIAQKAYLPIVANHTQVTPILCTRNSKTLSHLATKYRIKDTCSSVKELIKLRPDAVMIHSSTQSHYAIALDLLQANIPIFVDKPLSYHLYEVEELLNLATQKQLLIYLGFNRRFAPLIQNLTQYINPLQIFWKKNRVNLPGDPRTFIYDDFIHVVDSLRFLAKGTIKDLRIFSQMKKDKLENIYVQWQQNETLLVGSMNRVNGITEENIEYYTYGNKWSIDELNSGYHFHNGQEISFGFDNWKTTLYKRGFVNLFEDWLKTLQANKFEPSRIQDIWSTHELCETIVSQTLKKK